MTDNRKSPVETVSASLTLVGYELRPEELTKSLGIEPSFTEVTHFPAKFKPSGISGGRDCGLWSYDTAAVVSSSDIDEHLRHLLRLFRPLKSWIDEVNPPVNVFVHLRCRCASVLRIGPALSPRIVPGSVAGLAELGAALTIELIM